MALTNAFYEAVQSGNVRRVRIMMQDSLLVDPTFVEFNAMEKAAANMEGLYDEHDGKELNNDKHSWNDEYMSRVRVILLSNFSHERLEHLKEVVRYLRPVPESSYQEEKRRCQERGDFLGVKIGTGAVAGAAVCGVIAYIAGAPIAGVIGSIATGAVVGGVTTALIVNNGKKS